MSHGGLRHLTPVCPAMTAFSAPAAHVFISESSAPFFRFSQVRTKKGKRPKRERFADRPPELQDTKRLGVQRIRLEDRVARGPEAPYSIARNITQYLGRLVGEHGGEFHLRRAKDFTIRHKHRMLRFAGLTHDASKYDASLDRPQLTNLEALQREATLPASMREKRFPFPHLLSYSVYWSHDASPDPTPNAYDVGSVINV